MMMALLAKAVIIFMGFVGVTLIGKLPMSPFVSLGTNPMGESWLSAIGYIFPVSGMVSHTIAVLSCAAIWFVLRWMLRLIRAIG